MHYLYKLQREEHKGQWTKECLQELHEQSRLPMKEMQNLRICLLVYEEEGGGEGGEGGGEGGGVGRGVGRGGSG
jgi:hypothetical protein